MTTSDTSACIAAGFVRSVNHYDVIWALRAKAVHQVHVGGGRGVELARYGHHMHNPLPVAALPGGHSRAGEEHDAA